MILSIEKLEKLFTSFRIHSNDDSAAVWIILTLSTVFFIRISWAIAVHLLKESKAKGDFRSKARDLNLAREEADLIRKMSGSLPKSHVPHGSSRVMTPTSQHSSAVITDQKTFEVALQKFVETEDLSTEEKREELKEKIENIRQKCGFVNESKARTMDSTLSLDVNQRVALIPEFAGPIISGSVMTRDDIQIRIVIADGSVLPRQWKSSNPGHATLRFWRENDAEYSGRITILGTEKAQIPIIVISHSHELERKQKRKFLRVDVPESEALIYPLEVNDFTLRKNQEDVFAGPSIFKGVVKDISGGGLCLNTSFPFSPGDILLMDVSIPGLEQLQTLPGTVVKSTPQADNSHRISIHFTGIMEATREVIIHYVFRKQISARDIPDDHRDGHDSEK
ncbi:MAG: hypothetical protein CVV64_15920 [Candidatus Wallbacteria bacterium HGW-Wallbacteria-1]|jgi:c-di-GMP-binding flagellar brake protein YcgR|uniref:PilZ domain-containing protein n=1 Tax=Candidatus Wallbacteria bacterium HGW-Wallbacteria-1 TaxID=2013854 RepID=A0A2N1PLF8_9BACT|nr:MAG: hypothetical protein CVV64_15920 [Candidatus Wallbacteria bacterium HGW-Wallbacteria-1]